MINLNKFFPVKFYAHSDIDRIIQDSELKHYILLHGDNRYVAFYSTFNEDISTFLSKLPAGPVKEHVQNLMNKGLIYVAIAETKASVTFCRCLITVDNRLAGLSIVAQSLGVDPITGSVSAADDCVYALYFGLCRAAVLIHRDDIYKDKDLHKLMSTYVYFILMKSLGADKTYTTKSREFIHLISIYLYYRYYVKEKHAYILHIIEKEYKEVIDPKTIDEFLPTLDRMSDYDSIKDFPKILLELKLYDKSTNAFILDLLKFLKPTGFYHFIGPLDLLIGLAIISTYPFDLVSKNALVSQNLQKNIETTILKYIDKIKYDLTAIPKK